MCSLYQNYVVLLLVLLVFFFLYSCPFFKPFVCLCQMFYYQEDPYPPEKGIFKGHVKWSGDIMRKDASITLTDVLPTFNGTYICQVVNPPDAHGSTGETILRVVNKGEAVLCTHLDDSFLSA